MAKFIAAKHLGSLRAVDEAGEDALRKLGQGELVQVEIKKPRNIRHHRMFWALMTIIWENKEREQYPTVEDVAASVKIAAGLRTRIYMPDGRLAFIPGSIAFHKMDQTEFSAFYELVCDVVAKWFLPGVTSEELKGEVETMIGVRRAA